MIHNLFLMIFGSTTLFAKVPDSRIQELESIWNPPGEEISFSEEVSTLLNSEEPQENVSREVLDTQAIDFDLQTDDEDN